MTTGAGADVSTAFPIDDEDSRTRMIDVDGLRLIGPRGADLNVIALGDRVPTLQP